MALSPSRPAASTGAAFECVACGCVSPAGAACAVCGADRPAAAELSALPAPLPVAAAAGMAAAPSAAPTGVPAGVSEGRGVTRTADLDNALVGQKDHLLSAVNAAEYSEQLAAVLGLLAFARPVWAAAGYGYKATEVAARVRARAEIIIAKEREYLTQVRKNDRTAASTRSHIERLEKIAAGGEGG